MNCEKLKKKIESTGLKIVFIADQLGITRESFYKKLNGSNEFKASEIRKLSEILVLSSAERDDIFFDERVK